MKTGKLFRSKAPSLLSLCFYEPAGARPRRLRVKLLDVFPVDGIEPPRDYGEEREDINTPHADLRALASSWSVMNERKATRSAASSSKRRGCSDSAVE